MTMKKHITLWMVAGCLFMASADAIAGVLGDVDLDGRIGLTEAVKALQVTAGARAPLSASYVIVWKGSWAAGQDYQVYDAVQLDGSSYLCLQGHAAGISNRPPY
jgi:hypothetical protein